jgi:transposase
MPKADFYWYVGLIDRLLCNRHRDKIKILFWDTNGFWLYYRRLEKGRFKWPGANDEQDALTINQHQLNWLLSGLSLEVTHGHKPLNGLTVR